MTGRIAFLLICMTILGTVKGCNPKPVPQMSAEDMQTCDDLASQWISTEPGPSVPSSGAKPYMVIPAKAEITSPVYASILPFGPVVIQFKQPPADPGVSYRMLAIVVRTIAISGYQKWLVGDPITVVPLLPTNREVTWTPPDPGKYLIMVFFSNVETIPALGDNVEVMGEELQHMHWGDHYETYKIHNGPPSMAYACVQIDPLKAGVGANTLQPAILMPVENVTLPPTETRTATPWPTLTPTLSPTPIIPTLTSTFTKMPPTDIPTTVVDCRSYSNPDNCKRQDVCKWVTSLTRAPSCEHR